MSITHKQSNRQHIATNASLPHVNYSSRVSGRGAWKLWVRRTTNPTTISSATVDLQAAICAVSTSLSRGCQLMDGFEENDNYLDVRFLQRRQDVSVLQQWSTCNERFKETDQQIWLGMTNNDSAFRKISVNVKPTSIMDYNFWYALHILQSGFYDTHHTSSIRHSCIKLISTTSLFLNH